MDWLEESRRQWGQVFNDFRLACGYVNSAWYQATDKQSLKAEDTRRLNAIIEYAQKELKNWDERG